MVRQRTLAHHAGLVAAGIALQIYKYILWYIF